MRYVGAIILLLLSVNNQSLAYEHPFIEYTVAGTVIDWKTKNPISNVQFIVFLNESNYGDNPGLFEYGIDAC